MNQLEYVFAGLRLLLGSFYTRVPNAIQQIACEILFFVSHVALITHIAISTKKSNINIHVIMATKLKLTQLTQNKVSLQILHDFIIMTNLELAL